MYSHQKHIVGRKSSENNLPQFQNNQVEVHNFKHHSNNNNRKLSSGLKNFHKDSSHFDTSQFLQHDSPNNSNDYYRSFNHHFPELVTGCSPTFDEHSESTPIHGTITSSQQNINNSKVIDQIELNDDKSPKRFVSEFERSSHDERKMPNIVQKRPGFPQRIQAPMKPPTMNDDESQLKSSSTKMYCTSNEDQEQDNIDEFYDFDKEFFSPFQQQELQQQKLLEFQQQSKLQQVEKVLPLDNLDLESPQRSVGIPYSQLQRLVALKKIQQKYNYEHILQQHYENRNIIEEAYDHHHQHYDESIIEDDLEKLNCYANVQAKKFTMSPDATDNDSNCGDESEFSLKYNLNSDLSLTTTSDLNASGAFEHSKLDNCMPTLEDGLSDNESSYPDINYNNVSTNTNCSRKSSTSAHHQLESHHQQMQRKNRQLSSIDYNINNLHISDESISDDLRGERERNLSKQNTEPELIINNQNQLTSEVSKNLSSLANYGCTSGDEENEMKTSENSITTVNHLNIGSSPTKREDEEADTDLETDRLLGQQRVNELYGKLENKTKKVRCAGGQIITSPSLNVSKTPCTIRQGVGTYTVGASNEHLASATDDEEVIDIRTPPKFSKSPSGSVKSYQTDTKDVFKLEPQVLIEGVLFRARYLGSTQLICEGQPTKTTRMMQAEEAVARIKAPEGESQPSTEVDLFISIEKIMVLNTDLKEIMMDHSLKTISYIADIGSLVVLMARRRYPTQDSSSSSSENNNQETTKKSAKTSRMICHVFESEEAQFIAQSIGQAFQVAYMEFLKANGIEDHSFMKEMDYQEVLNSQEIFGDELEIFAKKELQKEVVVPKAKGEILGVVIVESGWGSMLPTVVIANLAPNGAAARCGHLNIGDQIIAINGLSLVGLPLIQCQNYVKNTKNQTAVKFTVVPCAPVVEVKIKRPNTKYQLGFSVQNGVICSLLRGGIAERGGVRVGHRIIEINNQSVVAVPHEKIVNLLATSVGEIMMKTMPTSMFRLLTGQENPFFI